MKTNEKSNGSCKRRATTYLVDFVEGLDCDEAPEELQHQRAFRRHILQLKGVSLRLARLLHRNGSLIHLTAKENRT